MTDVGLSFFVIIDEHNNIYYIGPTTEQCSHCVYHTLTIL